MTFSYTVTGYTGKWIAVVLRYEVVEEMLTAITISLHVGKTSFKLYTNYMEGYIIN